MKEEKLLTVGEAAARAGVSIRTLRHYDAIGLLRPAAVSHGGYRLYDGAAMRRLERILFLRELDFSLEQIAQIIDVPEGAGREAMLRQAAALQAKRERLDRIIRRLYAAAQGIGEPEFEVFDMSKIETMKDEYAQEAKARWGNTQAYKQSEQRTAAYSKADHARIQAGMDALMARFAAVRALPAADARVQALTGEWKAYITANYYDCTDEILEGLGQMYLCDERFRANIDRHGEGTARCMSEAIAAYVSARRN